MNTLTARAAIERTARRTVKPRVFEPMWKWAERNARLSVRTTNTPGKYDSGWIAYTRGWQEAFSNPRVKEIAICAAAQTGKTESILNYIRCAITEDAGPMLWIMPAESLARSFSENALTAQLARLPAVRGTDARRSLCVQAAGNALQGLHTESCGCEPRAFGTPRQS